MRSISTILCALSLVVLTKAASGLSYSAQPFCTPNATVFVTVSSATTIMLHDAATQTIYLNYPASQLEPTTTETRTNTLTISSAKLATVYTTSKTLDYDTTIAETDLVTVTNAQITAASSGEIVTYSEVAASDGLYDFIVANGTTYWLNGQTPAPASSYVVETSIVTVEPVVTSAIFASDDEDSTMTIHTTVIITQGLTITETISASSRTMQLSQVSGYPTAPMSFTGIASGGWNASTTARNVILGTSTSTLTIQTSLSSVNIYVKPPSITITSYAAESGFYQFTTSSSSSSYGNIASNMSTEAAIFTTASCTAEGSSLGTAAATTSPYVNSTSTSASTTGYVVQSITSITITSSIVQSSTSNEGFSTTSCTEASSTTASHVNATSILASITGTASQNSTSTAVISSPVQNSTADGAFTTSCAGNTTFSAGSLSIFTSSIPASVTSSAGGVMISTGLFPTLSTSAAAANSTSSAAAFNTGSTNGIFSSSIGLSRSFLTSYTSSVSNSSAAPSIVYSTYTVIPLPKSSVVLNMTAVPATWITLSSTPTTTYSSASATSTNCGEQGDFILNFDDLPPLTISPDQNTSSVNPMPLFNPYHQFDFSAGFFVVPPPTDPYLPSSKPLLLEFLPISDPHAPLYGYSGDIGNADHGLLGCFSFNAYGASFGCNSTGPDCDFTFSGFRYDSTTHLTNAVTSQQITVSACSGLVDCSLTSITLDNTFFNLDSVRINATVAGAPQTWWMDDIRFGWTDNSCAAGICRVKAHIH